MGKCVAVPLSGVFSFISTFLGAGAAGVVLGLVSVSLKNDQFLLDARQ